MTPKSEFTGTPDQVADRMQSWFEQGVCDGFLIIETGPRGLAEFVEHVVPVLQRRGVARTQYDGTTLRDNLQLPTPDSSYLNQVPTAGSQLVS